MLLTGSIGSRPEISTSRPRASLLPTGPAIDKASRRYQASPSHRRRARHHARVDEDNTRKLTFRKGKAYACGEDAAVGVGQQPGERRGGSAQTQPGGG